MFRITIFSLVMSLTAPAAWAECAGSSLLETLPPEDLARMDAALADEPYARGNLWSATRDGRTVHIVGTYHLDDPRHDAVFTRLAPLIDAAAVVLVEAGPEEEAKLKSDMARRPDRLFLTSGPTLPEQLAEEDWQALVNAMNARGIPAFLASKMQPWYVSMMLGIPPCAMREMLESKRGLDARIIDRATEHAIPVRALEPYDTVFGIFDGMSQEAKLDMIVTSLAMDERAEDYSATLAEAYFAENVRVTWELGRLAAYELTGKTEAEIDADLAEMEEAVMNSRNRAWIPEIEAALGSGPVFAAFGALHLSGEDGVLALLEREGFTLERLPFGG